MCRLMGRYEQEAVEQKEADATMEFERIGKALEESQMDKEELQARVRSLNVRPDGRL